MKAARRAISSEGRPKGRCGEGIIEFWPETLRKVSPEASPAGRRASGGGGSCGGLPICFDMAAHWSSAAATCSSFQLYSNCAGRPERPSCKPEAASIRGESFASDTTGTPSGSAAARRGLGEPARLGIRLEHRLCSAEKNSSEQLVWAESTAAASRRYSSIARASLGKSRAFPSGSSDHVALMPSSV